MHVFPSEVRKRLKNRFIKNHPDLLLYIDNPYIEEVINAIFEVLSEEIAELNNQCVKKDDLRRF